MVPDSSAPLQAATFIDHWSLDPAVTFCNHGSFGACPSEVLARQADLRARMERDPMQFLVRELPGLLEASRTALAAFVGCSAGDLVLVDNATTAVNTVLATAPLGSGDEVVVTDHGYRACSNAVEEWARRRGARMTVARVPFPLADPGEVLGAVLRSCTKRTRLAVLDHVTSPSALVFPIEELVAELRRRGIRVLVDGAHAPGMLPLALDRLGADYYTGNAHKWLCAPKGSGFLFVRRELQSEVRPLVLSHAASLPATDALRFQSEFGWTGTNDPTAWIAIKDAIEFGHRVPAGGWPERMRRNQALCVQARELLCNALSVLPPCPASMLGSLASVPLPRELAAGREPAAGVEPLQEELRSRFNIDVPVIPWAGEPFLLVRISAQLYNTIEDYARLAGALVDLRDEARIVPHHRIG